MRRDLNVKILGSVGILALAACGGARNEVDEAGHLATAASECVTLDEANYVFQDGKFRRVSAQTVVPATPARADTRWAGRVETALQAEGYDWLSLKVRQNTATLIGTAPDAATKAAALLSGEQAILADAAGADMNVIDAISVRGGEAAVGAALATLDEQPSLEACQKAFVDTMQNRNVEFRTGSATILPASARLLDATAGVATLCRAYNIEIGGHTDARGDPATNLSLSQGRADAVRDYLAGRGVDANEIVSRGYGANQLIDTSNTRTGDARNRRTEFKVSAR